MLVGKKILLIVTGSIAAIKTPEIISGLRDMGAIVTCVMTKSAEQFSTPLSLAAVSENQVYTELFSLKDESEMGHIRLSREADLIVIAPASANIMAKMANGYADDLASAILLASDKTILLAPAMNVKMWGNKAVQRNLKQLKKDGVKFVGPVSGNLVCGEVGMGRMSKSQDIISAIWKEIGEKSGKKPLLGKKVLITSGPTQEAIDPVRYITNRSSGKQGHAIAASLLKMGAEVTLVAGPTSQPDPKGVNVVPVESAKEMFEACKAALPVDVAVCAAAVSDWGIPEVSSQKIKKAGKKEDFTLTFAENPDILQQLSRNIKSRPELVIGFAAETEHVIENAKVKLEQKGCDWIVANDVSAGKVFDSDENKVFLIDSLNVDEWPQITKEEVAENLTKKISEFFADENLPLKIV